MKTIIAATANKGKIREIRNIVGPEVEVRTMGEMGFTDDIEEYGRSFAENALIKAKTVFEAFPGEYLVIADDSGLCIDYFDGKPGIYSSRWLGENTPYPEKIAEILRLMKDVPEEQRGAHYACAMVAVYRDEKGSFRSVICEETLEGRIAFEAAGDGGFGYDPAFYLPQYGATTGQLGTEFKNQISHRAKALNSLIAELKKLEVL